MNIAIFMVHWPGKDVPACEEHAEKLVNLGKFMGFAVTSSPCFPVRDCTNCENEAKIARPSNREEVTIKGDDVAKPL